MAPNQVSLRNIGLVRRSLYDNVLNPTKNLSSVLEILFVPARVGGHLRRDIYLTRQRKIFTTCKRITKERPFYKLTDDSGEIPDSSFNKEGLQK